MFNYNSKLLYLSVLSHALVSLHRTWKKVEQRRNSWKGVEEEKEEEREEEEEEKEGEEGNVLCPLFRPKHPRPPLS